MKPLRLSKSQWLLIIFPVGIWFSSYLAKYFLPAIAGAVLLALILLFYRKTVSAVFLALAFGLFYLQIFNYFLADLAPGCYEARVASNVKISDLKQEFSVKSAGAKAVVTTQAVEDFGYNDQLKICFAKENLSEVTGSYRYYLLSRYQSGELIKNPEIKFVSRGRGPLRALYDWSKSLGALLKKLFSGETAILARGLILGGSSDFSAETIADLRRSGTTHLVAVSGYNVAIITVQLFRVLRNTISRRVAFASTIVVLIIFCLMTGMTASVVRAMIFGLLMIVGKMLGRRSNAINSLLAAAFLMILVNPYVLWDIGFQLSFAAMLGLIVGGALFPVNSRKNFTQNLKSILLETIFAQIFTMPIILTAFGQISLLAPVANILILPLVPSAMALLGITLAAGLIWFWAGVFFASITSILLDYFLLVIKLIGGLPFAAVTVDKFPGLLAAGLYIVIAAGCVMLKRRIEIKV